MGQAWCKEKSTKAHDSKSPLDRVFLRCAHRIYPGLKDDSSVLGGATQRVTSSEIGYASSPPHSALTRGHSIDSVDRPFHPSEWVDVNLEVPGTPQYDPAHKSLTQNSNQSKSLTNMKDDTPVPPPRRRNKNKGRPLPPKPDEISRSEGGESTEDPLYTSVKKDTKDIYEYKVNGTGHSIPSDVVSKRPVDNRSSDVKSYCKVACEDERDRLFSRRRSMQHRTEVSPASTNFAEQDAAKRPKNCSTSSLPNYDELDGVKRDAANLHIDDKFRNNHSAGALHMNEIGCILRENTEDNDGSRSRDKDDNSISAVVDEARADFADSAESSLKLESAMRTSTPMKDAIGDNSISSKKLDEWFRRQDSSLNQLKESYFTAILGEGESELTSSKDNAQQTLKRTLSNESEPFDSFEEKELTLQLSGRPLVRAVSEESLPEEMLNVLDGTDNSDIYYSKNGVTGSAQSSIKTPPSTPEAKIKAELNMNGGLRRKKLLEEDAGSNLSSMTPSLTELEYALSDMLEKKETVVERVGVNEKLNAQDRWLEPKIVPLENDKALVKDETIHNTHEQGSQHLKNTRTPTSEIEIVGFDFKKKSPDQKQSEPVIPVEKVSDPPEKPSRSHRTNLDDSVPENAPTPPRRKNRSSSFGQPKDNSGFNDRLI